MRPRSDAATDGDRLGRVIVTGGLIRREAKPRLLCYAAVTARLIHRPAAAKLISGAFEQADRST